MNLAERNEEISLEYCNGVETKIEYTCYQEETSKSLPQQVIFTSYLQRFITLYKWIVQGEPVCCSYTVTRGEYLITNGFIFSLATWP